METDEIKLFTTKLRGTLTLILAIIKNYECTSISIENFNLQLHNDL